MPPGAGAATHRSILPECTVGPGTTVGHGHGLFVQASDGREDFGESAVDAITSHTDDWEEGGVRMYDRAEDGKGAAKTEQDHRADERLFRIRCHQAPEQLLID